MQKVTLRRLTYSDAGTFGQIDMNGFVFMTGELPWHDNHPDNSCVPPGEYTCKVTFSNRFKRPLYEVTDVPNRTSIRIHPANWMGDKTKGLKCQLEGCIALGYSVEVIEGQKGLAQSRIAVEHFMDMLNDQEFTLEIVA